MPGRFAALLAGADDLNTGAGQATDWCARRDRKIREIAGPADKFSPCARIPDWEGIYGRPVLSESAETTRFATATRAQRRCTAL